MKLTLDQYFGKWKHSPDCTVLRLHHAEELLVQVNSLMELAEGEGVVFLFNPSTGTHVSGAEFGGFRPQNCPIGAPGSAHKAGLAVDLYDPTNAIDKWCIEHSKPQGLLEQMKIYIEHPDATPGWSHWTTRAPASGNRAFRP